MQQNTPNSFKLVLIEPAGIHSKKMLRCVGVLSVPRYRTMLLWFSFRRVAISLSSSFTQTKIFCFCLSLDRNGVSTCKMHDPWFRVCCSVRSTAKIIRFYCKQVSIQSKLLYLSYISVRSLRKCIIFVTWKITSFGYHYELNRSLRMLFRHHKWIV